MSGRFRKAHAGVAEHLEAEGLRRSIDWAVLTSGVCLTAVCGLSVALAGLALGEPVARPAAALLLAPVALTGRLLWFLMRRAPH